MNAYSVDTETIQTIAISLVRGHLTYEEFTNALAKLSPFERRTLFERLEQLRDDVQPVPRPTFP